LAATKELLLRGNYGRLALLLATAQVARIYTTANSPVHFYQDAANLLTDHSLSAMAFYFSSANDIMR
jgi:hypothetical protein